MNCQLSTELLPPLPTSTPAPKTGAGVLSDCQKSLAEFAALAAKKIQWRIVKSSATQYHKKPHREISILDTFWDGDS